MVPLPVGDEYGVRVAAGDMEDEFAKGSERSDVMHRAVSPPEPKSEPGRAAADRLVSYNRRQIDARKTQHRVP
jgi:hypothetical protein